MKNEHWWRDRHKAWQMAVLNGREARGFIEWIGGDFGQPPEHILTEPLPEYFRGIEQ